MSGTTSAPAPTAPSAQHRPAREVRACKGLEIRESKTDGVIGVLAGYAATFNQRSEVMFDFVEIVKPGAFKRSLDSGEDVCALAHHQSAGIIGRRSAKTLRVSEDAKGLAIEVDVPDTTVGRDLLTLVKRGDITGMSFGFQTVQDKWSWEQAQGKPKLYIRELLDVDLFEVSAVIWPAYPSTSVEARSLEEFARAAIAELEQRKSTAPEPAPLLTPEQRAARDLTIEQYRRIRDIYGV
jgi:HK97 family phage prohead protease